MHYVYILKLSNGNYYTGYTTKLPQRITQHQQHTVHATKQVKSRELAFYSAFKTKKENKGGENKGVRYLYQGLPRFRKVDSKPSRVDVSLIHTS